MVRRFDALKEQFNENRAEWEYLVYLIRINIPSIFFTLLSFALLINNAVTG